MVLLFPYYFMDLYFNTEYNSWATAIQKQRSDILRRSIYRRAECQYFLHPALSLLCFASSLFRCSEPSGKCCILSQSRCECIARTRWLADITAHTIPRVIKLIPKATGSFNVGSTFQVCPKKAKSAIAPPPFIIISPLTAN